MSRKLGPRENFRVVIEPGDAYWISSSNKPSIEITCDEIVAEVRRHIDHIAHVYVDSDATAVCEHCGDTWTEDNPDFNGGCCDDDLVNDPDSISNARATPPAEQGETE